MLNYIHPDKNFSSKIAYRVSFERYQPLLSFYHLFSQFWIAFMRIFSTIFMTQKFHYTILLHKTHIGLEAQLNINQMTWFLNCDHFTYKPSQKCPGSQYLKTSCILNHPNSHSWPNCAQILIYNFEKTYLYSVVILYYPAQHTCICKM